MKNPYVLGILNILIPGSAYLILQKRRIFGALILASTIIGFVLMMTDPAYQLEGSWFFAQSETGKFLEATLLFFFMAAFGYDAYSLAKRKGDN